MPIPCPHFKITIVKRSQGQSAVAGAAYQSGERLFSEYDQKTKFYNKKKELVHAEIMLPSHAPPGYADRATLWNAVEAVENQWNSQLARRIVLAFPVEVPKEQYLSMIKEFCQEQFVSKGMIADFAIHDKGDGNPHAHILLTLRAMDEHGKWLPKARKVYDLDENGERIQLPSGNWKCRFQIAVGDGFPAMPPDLGVLLVVPVHRVFLVTLPVAGGELDALAVLVKVVDLSGFWKPPAVFVHCPER